MVLVCMVEGAVLLSVTMLVGTDVVVVALPPDTRVVVVTEETSLEEVVSTLAPDARVMVVVEKTSVEAVLSARVEAWETLFWREAALGMGTGTTVGTWDSADEREELASEVAWLSEEPTEDAWALREELACEAVSLAVPVARAAEGAMVMAVEGMETVEGSCREVV